MATDEEMQANYASFYERIMDVEDDPRTEFLMLEGYQNQPVVSINTATQKLSGLFRSISEDLSVVKERIAKVPTDNLSTEESAAIYLYTMGGISTNRSLYEGLNNALRAKTQALVGPYVPYLKLLIAALSKLDSIPQVVYRGINADLSEKYPIGKTFVWSKFSSCITTVQMLWSEHLLSEFGARTVFKIHCSNGKNIQQHSALSTENEIILLPGTRFKVISKLSPSKDFHIIEIQEIALSNLFRQRSSSISNEVNTFSLIRTNSEQIDDSQTLLKILEEQRDKNEGDFSFCNLNDEQIVLIANEVKTNTNWKMLKLNTNKLGDAGMVHLSSALVLNTTIEILFLDDNFIGDYGIRVLADTLLNNFTLVNITLDGNKIKETGAKLLADSLRTNSTLTDLSLDGNVIGDNGMIALCETLEQYNRTLRKLWVNNNNITDKSLDAILALRTMNRVLDDFIVDGNQFSTQALETLRTANKKHEEISKSLSSINEVIVLYLELKSIPEKRLSRDASFLFTNFRRLLNAEALENFLKVRLNNTIYLILSCEDDLTIRLISSFCIKRKILLYILRITNQKADKNVNIFSCEESMMFRLTTCIASQYRSFGDQGIQMNDKEKAKIYFQQGIDIQQRLVDYLKKRRTNPAGNQNGTNGIHKIGQFPDVQTSKSLISNKEN